MTTGMEGSHQDMTSPHRRGTATREKGSFPAPPPLLQPAYADHGLGVFLQLSAGLDREVLVPCLAFLQFGFTNKAAWRHPTGVQHLSLEKPNFRLHEKIR